MSLSELLMKYKEFPLMNTLLEDKDLLLEKYITIKKIKKNNQFFYKVIPLDLFFETLGSTTISIVLDSKYRVISQECGCLEHYRKKECAHTTILYALALEALNPMEYTVEYKKYKTNKMLLEHNHLLSTLIEDLKTSSSYFKKIHLVPEISLIDSKLYLSLHIGYDKEYIVKSISDFIKNMENNSFFSYGQKLSFVHSYEVLDDESKEFYNFLLNLSHEDSLKSILIKRGHFLTILEIYRNSGIYYTSQEKTKYYTLVSLEQLDIVLNDRFISINKPEGTKKLICGINSAYFIADEKIYAYHFKKRNEAILFRTLFKCNEKGLLIEANEVSFIGSLLPLIKREIQIEDSFFEKYSLPEVTIETYFEYQNGNIICQYQLKVLEEFKNTPYVNQIVDGYLQTLKSFGFLENEKGKYYLNSSEAIYQFLIADLNSIKNYGDVYFDESIKKIILKKSNKINISISYHVGLLDFQIDGGNLTLEEIQLMVQAYQHKKKFIKLKNDIILEIKEEDIKPLDNFLEDFNIDVSKINQPIQKPLNYLLKLVKGMDDTISCDDKVLEMIHQIQQYKDSNELPNEPFLSVLRPYQIDAFKWLKMLSKFGFGGILADDMGLGKTLEIISFLASDESQKPTLIVCPMSLVYNWENECMKWNLDLPVCLIIGSATEREAIIQGIDYNKKVIYITSYDSLRRDVELYTKTFRFVIADEAQYIKNQNTLKSTAIKQVQSDMNFALTGTPIENGLADLWSIFDYLMPGYLANYSHFKSRYEALILHDDEEALELLRLRVQPFILRRTKKDVLKELPDKIEEIYYCKMDPEQEKIYLSFKNDIKDNLKEGGNQVLALITRLRQICITPELIYDQEFNSAKLALALELITRAIASSHRILVFSQFASVFPILASMLATSGIKYYILDGTTKPHKRVELVEGFNSDESIKVFMISLKAGGTGLNLIGADMVIHLDPWWNVSAENQATDRAYRIGQTRNVHVLKLVCKNTIEEKVLLLQKVKNELAQNIIHSQEDHILFTKNDILKILD